MADDDLCKRVVNCRLRLASRSFCTDNRLRRRRGFVGGVGGGVRAVLVELFTSEVSSGDSGVLPPLQQRPSSEGGGEGGALDIMYGRFSATFISLLAFLQLGIS